MCCAQYEFHRGAGVSRHSAGREVRAAEGETILRMGSSGSESATLLCGVRTVHWECWCWGLFAYLRLSCRVMWRRVSHLPRQRCES